MTKLTEKALERKICRGELEVEYRQGDFVECRNCRTNARFTCKLVG